jgi:type I restriction enzyme R subunit
MVDHFHEQVLSLRKIGGQARALVVTSGIAVAIQYYHAIRNYLVERKSPYQAIVAFSGEHDYGGANVTEASLNGFPSGQIADKIQQDPYRFLVCADKFQTGYDEPLLQTLSRLNRAHPKKHDVFVLDFMNDADTIQDSFADYYRTTILSEETDPDKLHDLLATLDGYQVYAPEQVNDFVKRYLGGAERDQLDPILDACVAVYKAELDEQGQVGFKGQAKVFTRTYAFLSSVLPYTNAQWEKRSIFLNFLISKLPAPVEEDLSRGILETIDMDSYRVEKQATRNIQLLDEDGEIDPSAITGGGYLPETELDQLSNIIKAFNDQFGNYPWDDIDRVRRLITEDIPARVAADSAYKNAQEHSDKQNARIEHDKALGRVIIAMMNDDTKLFKQFVDNEWFKRFVTDISFGLTYQQPAAAAA